MSLVTEQPWMNQGACTHPEVDHEWWFPSTPTAPNIQRAVAHCAKCPVRQQCDDYANQTQPAEGIWGGLTPWQRARGDTFDTREPDPVEKVGRKLVVPNDVALAAITDWTPTTLFADRFAINRRRAWSTLNKLHQAGLADKRGGTGYGQPVEWRAA